MSGLPVRIILITECSEGQVLVPAMGHSHIRVPKYPGLFPRRYLEPNAGVASLKHGCFSQPHTGFHSFKEMLCFLFRILWIYINLISDPSSALGVK